MWFFEEKKSKNTKCPFISQLHSQIGLWELLLRLIQFNLMNFPFVTGILQSQNFSPFFWEMLNHYYFLPNFLLHILLFERELGTSEGILGGCMQVFHVGDLRLIIYSDLGDESGRTCFSHCLPAGRGLGGDEAKGSDLNVIKCGCCGKNRKHKANTRRPQHSFEDCISPTAFHVR